mmetsp:Transcript_9514/g.8222  ORF Transcript_9514/g.8222 Transcript_9514/m.8222 type:complete len:120 (+) Transcript_9514:141-500(+)
MHVATSVYFLHGVVAGLKIIYVQYVSMTAMALLEMMFGDPRPYWDDPTITGVYCANSYGFPSYSQFCLFLLLLYSFYCVKKENEAEKYTPKQRLWGLILFGVFILLSLWKVIAGIDYLS